MHPHILWVATKTPLPAVDGGRLLLVQTLRALAAQGARVTLVAPCRPEARAIETARLASLCVPYLVPVRPAPWNLSWLPRAGVPLAAARHAPRVVQQEVGRLVATGRFDVVQAEQLQALPSCIAARAAGLPVVLRAQNVESDLWARQAAVRPLLAPLLRRGAHALARWEGLAVREAAATVALTARDAARLAALAGGGVTIERVAAPFVNRLPPGQRLAGAPAVVLFGSGGWFPNHHGARWFVAEAWPAVRRRLPGAVLHVFGLSTGGGGAGIVPHPAPAASRTAFPAGAVSVVPLRVASGIRMKILEAWARDLPVVATPEAAAGLDAEPGRELLIADDGEQFASAVARVHEDASQRQRLTAAGRAALAEHNHPDTVASDLLALYARVA